MKTFGHGMFYGATEHRQQVGAIALAELQPTVPEHDVESHTHSDAHCVLVLSGRYLSSARGMPAISRGPALVYNPPGTTHRDCFRGLDGARFLTVSLPAEAVIDRGLPEDAVRADAFCEQAAHALRATLHDWDDIAPLDVDTGIEALLDRLAQRQRMERDDGPAWLARARERLRDDCMRPPRIEELARIVGVHPVAFARAFRRRYGRSPGDYLRECRLEHAAALLRDHRLSLADIAMRTGFVDQSHFTRSFRRGFGCTPAVWRQAR